MRRTRLPRFLGGFPSKPYLRYVVHDKDVFYLRKDIRDRVTFGVRRPLESTFAWIDVCIQNDLEVIE